MANRVTAKFKMIEIMLTKGKKTIIDDCDAHLADWKWFLSSSGYAVRSEWLRAGKWVFLHHAILGRPLDGQVDHIDGDRLNNRRSNLRFCSHRENGQNQKCHRNRTGSSIYVGVTKRQWSNNGNVYWAARIKIDGHRKHLGYFKTEEEAANVYRNAVLNLSSFL